MATLMSSAVPAAAAIYTPSALATASSGSNKKTNLSQAQPTLLDLLQAYPIFESIIVSLDIDSLYALSQTCKDIHFLLRQGSEGVWNSLKAKALPRACNGKQKHPNKKGCYGPIVKCIGCKDGICSKGGRPLSQLEEYVQSRLRQSCCRDCMEIAYQPRLTTETKSCFFKEHTLAQLTAGKLWQRWWALERFALERLTDRVAGNGDAQGQAAQAVQQQSASQQSQHLSLEGTLSSFYRIPTEIQKPTTLPLRVVNQPDLYSIRIHQDSHCKCRKYLRYIPLCYHCVEKIACLGFKYNAFLKSDPGVCECGNLLWAMDGMNGEVIEPTYLSDIIAKSRMDMEGDTVMTGIEEMMGELGGAAGTADAKGKGKQQEWMGVCHWCGFRVKKDTDTGVSASLAGNQVLDPTRQQQDIHDPAPGQQSTVLQAAPHPAGPPLPIQAVQQTIHQIANQISQSQQVLSQAAGQPLMTSQQTQQFQQQVHQLNQLLQTQAHHQSQAQTQPSQGLPQIDGINHQSTSQSAQGTQAEQQGQMQVLSQQLQQHQHQQVTQPQGQGDDHGEDIDDGGLPEEDEEYDYYDGYYDEEDWDDEEDVHAYALSTGLLDSNPPSNGGSPSEASSPNHPSTTGGSSGSLNSLG